MARFICRPTQSLETYQFDAVNPTPDIAGLNNVVPRMLALPHRSNLQRSAQTLELKPCKTFPLFLWELQPKASFLLTDKEMRTAFRRSFPPEKYGNTSNVENPELYVAFPYRLYGVGKPGLDLARANVCGPPFPLRHMLGPGWNRGGNSWADYRCTKSRYSRTHLLRRPALLLVLEDEFRLDPRPGQRGLRHDYTATMLMQCDGRRIQLLPAWPAEWTADFKLHAPYQTTVEGHVENGKVTQLKVTPSSRAKDVVILPVD